MHGAEPTGTAMSAMTNRRGVHREGGGQPTAALLSLLPLARHLGYGFLPVPWVDRATIAAAAGPRQEAARILRDDVCNGSDRRQPAAGTVGAD